MFGRRRRDAEERRPGSRPAAPARQPVEVIAEQLAVAKLAKLVADHDEYEHARDAALSLVFAHQVKDELLRFCQVMTAITGYLEYGEDVRELIEKRLRNAFTQGVERGLLPRDVTHTMLRIPRAAALNALARDLRLDDGPRVIHVLFSDDGGELSPDIVGMNLGATADTVADTLTVSDWSAFAQAMLTVEPGELRPELTEKARSELRRILAAVAAREQDTPARNWDGATRGLRPSM
jgi:hypothetical protein